MAGTTNGTAVSQGRRPAGKGQPVKRATSDIKDVSLAKAGRSKIEWAERQMPVLLQIRERVARTKPLKDFRVAACLHVTTETAHLMLTLQAAGAQIALCASNPLSTQDDVAASLVKDFGIPVFAIRGEDRDTYYKHIESVLSISAHVTMDDGADLVSMVHQHPEKFGRDMIGGTEETTTGVIRLRSLQSQGKLRYPVIAVNDAQTKHLFDNRYGTGQSTIDGVIRATNQLIAGSVFVVGGYGWCGKGLAQRAKGLGGRVVVTEINPVRALEAVMDGFEVRTMDEIAPVGDFFVTVTGCCGVITERHFSKMKDGAVVANSGHFDVELDLVALKRLSAKHQVLRDGIDQYTLKNGRRVNVLGEGRLVNLACAEGHPPGVMDMSFANQALSCEYMKQHAKTLKRQVYSVPEEIDREIAALKLKAIGVSIDTLTKEQSKYLSSWEIGT